VEENNQINIIDKATEKAQKQIEKERKNEERNYIAEWFRYVELTSKYLKNKLN
tara:strand:- start:176 stop:334 length:159 start_codon:yes stop_codon:yes gene_type:complete